MTKIGAPARQERGRAAAMKRSRSSGPSSGNRNDPRRASSISRRVSAIARAASARAARCDPRHTGRGAARCYSVEQGAARSVRGADAEEARWHGCTIERTPGRPARDGRGRRHDARHPRRPGAARRPGRLLQRRQRGRPRHGHRARRSARVPAGALGRAGGRRRDAGTTWPATPAAVALTGRDGGVLLERRGLPPRLGARRAAERGAEPPRRPPVRHRRADPRRRAPQPRPGDARGDRRAAACARQVRQRLPLAHAARMAVGAGRTSTAPRCWRAASRRSSPR